MMQQLRTENDALRKDIAELRQRLDGGGPSASSEHRQHLDLGSRPSPHNLPVRDYVRAGERCADGAHIVFVPSYRWERSSCEG